MAVRKLPKCSITFHQPANQLIQEILQELNVDITLRQERMLKEMVKQLIIFSVTKSDENSEISEESEDDHELIHDSQEVINSLEIQLKEKDLDEGYKLRLTAILQYMRLPNFKILN